MTDQPPRRRSRCAEHKPLSEFRRDSRGFWRSHCIPSERPTVGVRKREWQAVAPTEEEVVGEMARCLREIAAGKGAEVTGAAVGKRWSAMKPARLWVI